MFKLLMTFLICGAICYVFGPQCLYKSAHFVYKLLTWGIEGVAWVVRELQSNIQ
jgi:hypothetical protein